MFTPLDLMNELFINCINIHLNHDVSNVTVECEDDKFFNFDSSFRILCKKNIGDETLEIICQELTQYCINNYQFCPSPFPEFEYKLRNNWYIKISLTLPQSLFKQYINYKKLKNKSNFIHLTTSIHTQIFSKETL